VSTDNPLANHAIVACGTLQAELKVLAKSAFRAERILFTAPGLHERPKELAEQLFRQVAKAREASERVIVVYGAKCFIDSSDPARGMDALLQEQGPGLLRVKASNCIDMLVSAVERDRIADGQKVYWLTPGWLKHWRYIFRDWDAGKANETFPMNDKAVLLDGIGFYEQYSLEKPEEILAFSDWMKIPIEPLPISLERLGKLISEASAQDR